MSLAFIPISLKRLLRRRRNRRCRDLHGRMAMSRYRPMADNWRVLTENQQHGLTTVLYMILELRFWAARRCDALFGKQWSGTGRHTDLDPLACTCGWVGSIKSLCHGYEDDGTGEDVTPVDNCPQCYAEF